MKKKCTPYCLAELAAILLTCAALLISVCFFGLWLTPERDEYGASWKAYLAEEENTADVLFFGSSIVYCDVIPAEIYARSGLTSFVMAGPEQTAPVTAAYVRQALKTQSPSCIFVEASCAFYPETTNYSYANVCFMPWSVERLQATLACEAKIWPAAFFPLKDFHYRIYEPQDTDKAHASRMLAGYTYLDDTASDLQSEERYLASPPGSEQYRKNLKHLSEIADVCESEKIALYFYIAPCVSPVAPAEREKLIADLQALSCRAALDWTDAAPEIGIENQSDWYDHLHFNFSGAEKFSRYLSDFLTQNGIIPAEKENPALWQERITYLQGKKQ